MAGLKPYDPNKSKISINIEGWLDRMAKAGIPLTRALKYFRDNPEGNALKTVKLAAEDMEPTGFYYTYMNDGDVLDYVTEAIMLGMPMSGPKAQKKVMTPKGEKTYYVNQGIPELDVERNQKLKRLFDETDKINYRKSDSPWYYDEYEIKVGDTPEGSDAYQEGSTYQTNSIDQDVSNNRYKSKAIDPDDFNKHMDEYESMGIINAADDYKFDVNSQEYAKAKQTAADLDKIYSEMNDDTALLTNEEKINKNLEGREFQNNLNYEYTRPIPKTASDVFDFVANDPELIDGAKEMYGQYPSIHDNIYTYSPETVYMRPAEDLVNASISKYTEPYRITMRDFDQMTNLVNDLRDPKDYYKNWPTKLKQEISNLKENELLTAQDKERMKEAVDYYTEQLQNEPDPERRKTLLSFLKNELDANGLIYDGI